MESNLFRRRSFLRMLAFSALVIGSLGHLAPVQAEDTKLLNDGEIIALLNGATFEIKSLDSDDRRYHHFGPVEKVSQHGKLDVKNITKREVEPGIWWVEEEQFCVLYGYVVQIRKRCFAVARDGKDIQFIETRYEIKGKGTQRPHQIVPSAQLFDPSNSVGNFKLLTDEEIIATMNGMTLDIWGLENPKESLILLDKVEKPGQHGVTHIGSARGGGIHPGVWWVEDEQFCLYFPLSVGIRKRCLAIARDGDELLFIDTRWEQPGKNVQRPHQWGPSTKIFRTRG